MSLARAVLESFSQATFQSAFVLLEAPQLLFSQLFNRLRGQVDATAIENILESARHRFGKPWFRIANRRSNADALIGTFIHPEEPVRTCRFSADGKLFVAGGHRTIAVWEVCSGKQVAAMDTGTDHLEWCCFSRDGKTLLTYSREGAGVFKRWDLCSMREVQNDRGDFNTFFEEGFTPSRFGPEVSSVSYLDRFSARRDPASDNKVIVIDDRQSGREITRLISRHGEIQACAFSPDGETLLTTSRTLQLWRVRTGEQLNVFPGHTFAASDCAFSADGKQFLSAGPGGTGYQGVIRLWRTELRPAGRVQPAHEKAAYACSCSSDGSRLASIGFDETIKIWGSEDLLQERVKIKLGSYMGRGCMFNWQGDTLLTGSATGELYLWDVGTGSRINSFSLHSSSILNCAISPDGDKILSVDFLGTMKIWSINEDREMASFAVDVDGFICGCAISPDGKHALATNGSSILICGLDNGQEEAFLDNEDAQTWDCAWSPNGQKIVAVDNKGRIRIWDFQSKQAIKTIGVHPAGRVCSFLPDGERVVTAGHDESLRIWDTDTGEALAMFKGFTGRIQDIDVDPRGGRLVLVDDAGQLLLLSLENFSGR